MSSPDYTNLMILKSTLERIAPAREKLEEELKKATGIRVRVTNSMLVDTLIDRYMKGEKKS
jgi:hypothetical protein